MTQNKKSAAGGSSKRMLVAITGGIGSGKSTFSAALKEAGYPVISCDEVCAKLYKSPVFTRKLKKYFPSAIKGFFLPKVDKGKLADVAFFSDDDYRILSERVTAPVYKKVMTRARRRHGIVFVEVPLLFECGKEGDFDKVVVLLRRASDREEWVERRSGLEKNRVEARMARQVNYETIDLSPYIAVFNDGDKEALREKARRVAETLAKTLNAEE